jgi:N6-adenosine-specific RNA methylase IME4
MMPPTSIPTPPHAGSYGVIYADPPWKFKPYSDKGKGRSAEAHFDCMELDEIKALPVRSWALRTPSCTSGPP